MTLKQSLFLSVVPIDDNDADTSHDDIDYHQEKVEGTKPCLQGIILWSGIIAWEVEPDCKEDVESLQADVDDQEADHTAGESTLKPFKVTFDGAS